MEGVLEIVPRRTFQFRAIVRETYLRDGHMHFVGFTCVPTVSQWPHNGRITALFPEVTHEDFFRSVLGSAVGFKRDEIQSSLISPWEKFVS